MGKLALSRADPAGSAPGPPKAVLARLMFPRGSRPRIAKSAILPVKGADLIAANSDRCAVMGCGENVPTQTDQIFKKRRNNTDLRKANHLNKPNQTSPSSGGQKNKNGKKTQ